MSKPKIVGECIDGPGERTRLGYVRLWNGGNRVLAHRKAYQEAKGTIPEGYEVDHLCGNRWCRNPDHLEAVTHKVNAQRSRNRKLSPEVAERIRREHVPRKVTQVQLAKKYGVSRETIQQVLYGRFYS